MTPHFNCAIRASRDHLARFCGMMFGPGDDLFVHFRRRIWLHQLCLSTTIISGQKMNRGTGDQLTSSKSHAQTAPLSSPQTTLASAEPKHARQRYTPLSCPANELSILPVAVSISLMWESSVVTRRVWPSWVGTTAVTGSVEGRRSSGGWFYSEGRALTSEIVGS